jgi:hypothetical protein
MKFTEQWAYSATIGAAVNSFFINENINLAAYSYGVLIENLVFSARMVDSGDNVKDFNAYAHIFSPSGATKFPLVFDFSSSLTISDDYRIDLNCSSGCPSSQANNLNFRYSPDANLNIQFGMFGYGTFDVGYVYTFELVVTGERFNYWGY